MLNALWRDDKGTKDLGPLTLRLCNAVKARLIQDNLFKHRAINDPKQLENGLRDYLLDFFTLILDEEAATKAGVSSEFRESMVKSLKVFNQWGENYQKNEIRKKDQGAVDRISGMIKNAAGFATGLEMISGRKGLARAWSAVRRAVKGEKGDYSSQQSTGQPWMGALTFAIGLAMVSYKLPQSSWSGN